jgi:hypothetical protein
MALSRRERILVGLAPAILVVGAYWVFHARPAARKVATLRGQNELLQSKIGASDPRFELAATRQEWDIQNAELEKTLERWRAVSGTHASEGNRPGRIEKLNAALENSGLTVTAEVDLESGSARSAAAGEYDVPGPLKQKMIDLLGATAAKPRSISFYGTYPQVVQGLEAISKDVGSAIPMRVYMKPADVRTNLREWVLLIWV